MYSMRKGVLLVPWRHAYAEEGPNLSFHQTPKCAALVNFLLAPKYAGYMKAKMEDMNA